MPEFPRYNSKATLNTEPNAVVSTGAGDQLNMVSQAAGQATDITIKWAAAVDNMAETAIKSNIASGIAQIEAESDIDPDINGEKNRIEQIKKLRASAMGNGLQNKSLQVQLGLQLDNQVGLAELKINNIYAKKKMLADGLNTQSLLENYAGVRSQAIQAGNNTIVAETDKAAFDLIQKKVATQLMTEAQGKEAWKNYRLGSVDFDIQSDPSIMQKSSPVLQELLKGKEGRYSFLTNEELGDKIKTSKINIWRNKVAQEKAMQENNTQGAIDLSKQLANKTLTLSTIDNMFANKIIDAKTATIFTNAVDTAQRTYTDADKTKTAEYLISILEKGKISAIDMLSEATKLKASKDLDDTAYGWVIQETAKKLDREKKGLSGFDQVTNIFLDSVKAISNFALGMFQSNTNQVSDKMVKKLIERVVAGETPENAIKSIQKETVLEYHPEALTYPKGGKKVIDSNGIIKTITPEGDVLDTELEVEDNGI